MNMNEPDFSTARVGDRVWDLFRGEWRQIVFAEPAHALWIDGLVQLCDGKQNGVQRFYWSPPTITGGCEPPKRMVKKTVWQNLYHYGACSVRLGERRYESESTALSNVSNKDEYLGVVKREIEVEE